MRLQRQSLPSLGVGGDTYGIYESVRAVLNVIDSNHVEGHQLECLNVLLLSNPQQSYSELFLEVVGGGKNHGTVFSIFMLILVLSLLYLEV